MPMNGSLTLNVVDDTVLDIEGRFPEILGFCPKCGEPVTHDATESCYSCGYKYFQCIGRIPGRW